MKKYFIQSKGDEAQDIYDVFGIRVKEVKGLLETPPIKSPFSKDWKDEQGKDVYIPDNIRFKEKTVKITFLVFDDDGEVSKSKIKAFFKYLFKSNYVSYYDTYRSNGFYGYYNKETIGAEKYRVNLGYIEFDVSFVVPNGICFGLDNIGEDYLSISVEYGYADLHLADGTTIEKATQGIYNSSIRDDQNFIIICPSHYNNVHEREPVPMGIRIGSKPLAYKVDKPMGF